MPRTKNAPRRSEGGDIHEPLLRCAAAPAAAAPAPHPNNAPPLGAGGASGPSASGVTIKQGEEEEEEEEQEEEVPRRDGAARVPASGPCAAIAATPAPALHNDAPAGEAGAVGSGVTLVKEEEEEEEETLAQQRDRLALALAHGPVRVDSHIKVEDSTSGEDTEGDAGEEGLGGKGGDGGGEEGRARRGGWCCSRGRHTPRGTTGEHLAGAPLRTGRLGRRGGELPVQPTTSCLMRLHRSGNMKAHKSARLGATACTSSPEGTFARPPRCSNGARH